MTTAAMSQPVDLRSDTLTRPTDPMRRAMASAPVGDDVYGEDPTINALEQRVADLFGLAAAVFVPSGTMSNQIGLALLCPPGTELVCDADAHVVSYEAGAAAAYGGIQSRTLPVPRGLLTAELAEPMLRSAGYHTVPTRAVAVEQTHNRGGGAVHSLASLQQLRLLLNDRDIALHVDGARIWNAHIATGVPLADYGAVADTMSVCLSKGLGAPVGSLLVLRDAAAAEPARELRHRLGGAMRQAGILAAAGSYALDHHLDRLADDHARAHRLAEALAEHRPGSVDPAEVETNIVLLDLDDGDAAAVTEQAAADGVLVAAVGPHRLRLVTHLDVDEAGIDRTIDVLRRLF